MTESIKDLNHQYGHTYIKYNKRLVWVSTFHKNEEDDEEGEIYLSGEDKEGNIQEKFYPEKLEVLLPDSCFFNPYPLSDKKKEFTQGALKFFRFPRRQWKRSLYLDICTFLSPLERIYAACGMSLPWRPQDISMEKIERLIHAEYPKLEEALSMLSNLGAIAVSPYHCVTISHLNKDPLITDLFGFIGDIDLGQKVINIYHKPAFQEAQDFISRSRQREWRVNAA